MPKVEIDYSNTIIYKITCKESSITDLYVGHTTNFVQRKHAHKQSCINLKSNNYNCKLYKVIRENGGWQNWTMEIVNFFNCHDHYEARKKEQEYFLSLNATLNSIEPMPKPKDKINPIAIDKIVKPTCDVCNNFFDSVKLYDNHNNKHKKMLINDTNLVTNTYKNTDKFVCDLCDFKCFKKGDYNRHLFTPKHKNMTEINKTSTLSTIITSKNTNSLICQNCNKQYKERTGLWKHKKKCYDNKNPDISLTNLVLEVVKSNTELQKQNDEFKSLIIEQNNDFKNIIIEQNSKMLETVQEVCKNGIN
jgi:hypothetical protein